MKHRKKGRKLSRQRDQRKALLKGLAANLILKEKITTTEAKAKEVRPFVEKLITKGKLIKGVALTDGQKSVPEKEPAKGRSASNRNNLAAIRYLARYLPVKAREKLISQISPQYQKRDGGYTRIIKLGLRRTDGAKMAMIELIK